MKYQPDRPVVRTEDVLSFMLDAAVRLRIEGLKAMNDEAYAWMWREWTNEVHLDNAGLWNEGILFGSNKVGETATAFNAMAKAIAALAFMPGGITVFNQHYEAKRDGTHG